MKLVVGRFIAGIAVGLTSSTVPVYQSEIAPKDVRGRLVSLQQWAITWGIMVGTHFLTGTNQY
jgi:MFS family permease